MSVWNICGGKELAGSVLIPGSWEVAAFFLAATLLAGCEAELTNCPQLRETEEILHLFRRLGCAAERAEDVIRVDTRPLCASAFPPECPERLPCPELFATALSVRRGEPRRDGVVCLPESSVFGTACAMLAACGARGRTVLVRSSREPEIAELRAFLQRLGVRITGMRDGVLVFDGFSPARNIGQRVCPSRYCASAVLCACAGAGGDVELRGVTPAALLPLTEILDVMGCETETNGYVVRCRCRGRLNAGQTVITGSYPGLSPAFVPLLMAATLGAKGRTVFSDRSGGACRSAANAMRHFGGDVRVMGSVAVVNGKQELHAAAVRPGRESDGAALSVAALGIEGISQIECVCEGAEKLAALYAVLSRLGASIGKSSD